MRELVQLAGNFKRRSQPLNVEAIAKALEDGYLQGRRSSGHRQKKSFAPSGVGYGYGRCPRYWYFAFNGVHMVDDADALAIANMNYGTEAHERIQGLFERAGILLEHETEIRHEDPPIFGFMDAMIEVDGEPVVVEIKTTKQESFMMREASRSAPGYHMIQLLIYMHIKKVDKGCVLYENKNTGEFLIIPVEMNDENRKLVEDTFDWMRKVYKNATDGELPKRPFTPSNPACKSCPVSETCWAGYVRTVKSRGVKGEDPNPGTVDLPVLEVPN